MYTARAFRSCQGLLLKGKCSAIYSWCRDRSTQTIIVYGLILFSILGCSEASQNSRSSRTWALTSGLPGGHYNTCAKLIADEFDSLSTTSRINVIPSEGSFENMDRLRKGLADLAIVQRDVLASRFYDKDEPFSEVEILLPLFPEALQVLVHCDSLGGAVDFLRFSQLVKEGRITHVAIGPAGSVTNQTAKRMFDLLGLEVSPSFYIESAPDEYLRQFENGDLTAVAMLSAAPVTNINLPFKFKPAVLSLTNDEVSMLISYLHNLDPVSLSLSIYDQEENGTFQTIGTWALLVGRRGVSSELERTWGRNPTDIALRALVTGAPTYNQVFGQGCSVHFNHTEAGWSCKVKGTRPDVFFKGIGLTPALESMLNVKNGIDWRYLAMSLFVLAFMGALIHTLRKIRTDPKEKQKWTTRWFRYQQFVYAGGVFLLIAISLPPLINHLELAFCEKYGLHSHFLDVSIWDKYTWLLVLSLSGQNNGLFPISTAARVVTSASMFLQYVNVGYLALYTYIKEQRRKKRLTGKAMSNFQDHLVVFGWNDTAIKLISDLLLDQEGYSGRRRGAIVVHPKASEKLSKESELKSYFEQGKVLQAVNEDPKTEVALIKSNVKEAHTVILLADSKCEDPDERTLVRALAISRHLERDLNGTVRGKIYVIAEVRDGKLRDTFLKNEVDEVICSSHFTSNLLFQSSINHGVSSVFDELVDHEKGNEFYVVELSEHDWLQDRTFDDLLGILRDQGILLLGIKSASGSEVGKAAVRGTQRTRPLEAEPMSRIMINPSSADERPYRTKVDDQLVVLAESHEVIRGLAKPKGRPSGNTARPSGT